MQSCYLYDIYVVKIWPCPCTLSNKWVEPKSVPEEAYDFKSWTYSEFLKNSHTSYLTLSFMMRRIWSNFFWRCFSSWCLRNAPEQVFCTNKQLRFWNSYDTFVWCQGYPRGLCTYVCVHVMILLLQALLDLSMAISLWTHVTC